MKTSKIIRLIKKVIFDPAFRFRAMSRMGFYNNMSDENYLKKSYRIHMGEVLNLDNPTTFNEKIQWLKIHDRQPEHIIMADKYKVREYIASKIGQEYLIPLIGVWDKPDEIDFDKLPNQFVLKCNHNSGKGMYICKNKSALVRKDFVKIRNELQKGLQEDYYIVGREWTYKDIPRKIICEEYMEDKDLGELRDYKFFCFNGHVRCFKVDFDRFKKHRANYYSPQGELIACGEQVCPPDMERQINMPKNLKLMIQLAEKLAEKDYFLRVDFYEVNNKVYFGELTFYPANGLGKFIDRKWDYILGDWMSL